MPARESRGPADRHRDCTQAQRTHWVFSPRAAQPRARQTHQRWPASCLTSLSVWKLRKRCLRASARHAAPWPANQPICTRLAHPLLRGDARGASRGAASSLPRSRVGGMQRGGTAPPRPPSAARRAAPARTGGRDAGTRRFLSVWLVLVHWACPWRHPPT